jgi:hypothetical protein
VPDRQTPQSGRLPSEDQFLRRTLHGKEILVWVGSGEVTAHEAVNEYMRLARTVEHQVRIEPTSPCHVIAGVPAGSFIFGKAWDAMMICSTMRKPRREELMRMVDVVAAIKHFRGQTRMAYQKAQREAGRKDIPFGAPHFFWTGEIKVSWQESTAYYTHSKFWR